MSKTHSNFSLTPLIILKIIIFSQPFKKGKQKKNKEKIIKTIGKRVENKKYYRENYTKWPSYLFN